jgi:hypothetical protein
MDFPGLRVLTERSEANEQQKRTFKTGDKTDDRQSAQRVEHTERQQQLSR